MVSLGVVSSNQVGRTDWTPMGLAGIIHAGTKTVINCTFQMTCKFCGLTSGVIHLVEGCCDFQA